MAITKEESERLVCKVPNRQVGIGMTVLHRYSKSSRPGVQATSRFGHLKCLTVGRARGWRFGHLRDKNDVHHSFSQYTNSISLNARASKTHMIAICRATASQGYLMVDELIHSVVRHEWTNRLNQKYFRIHKSSLMYTYITTVSRVLHLQIFELSNYIINLSQLSFFNLKHVAHISTIHPHLSSLYLCNTGPHQTYELSVERRQFWLTDHLWW